MPMPITLSRSRPAFASRSRTRPFTRSSTGWEEPPPAWVGMVAVASRQRQVRAVFLAKFVSGRRKGEWLLECPNERPLTAEENPAVHARHAEPGWRFIPTGPVHASLLLTLVQEFYAIEGIPYDEPAIRRTLEEFWAHPDLGRIELVEVDGEPAGYMILTFCPSLEFHGRFGLVDELYVREGFRGQGLGTAALRRAEAIGRAEGLEALRLEVARTNTRAQQLYRGAGFRDQGRDLLTKWLV